jgi:hypothetical protein
MENSETKSRPLLRKLHQIGFSFFSFGHFRADFRLCRYFFDSNGNISRLQTFEADIAGFQFDFVPYSFPRFDCDTDYNYFIINILI